MIAKAYELAARKKLGVDDSWVIMRLEVVKGIDGMLITVAKKARNGKISAKQILQVAVTKAEVDTELKELSP